VSGRRTFFFLEAECVTFSIQKQTFDLLEGWLRHKSDMVNYEAARAICEMKNISGAQLTKPIAG
jgi:coatomer protein complex subunit gamma